MFPGMVWDYVPSDGMGLKTPLPSPRGRAPPAGSILKGVMTVSVKEIKLF